MAAKPKEEVCDTTQAVQMFHMFGAAFKLRYNTPSRIPVRMQRALEYLVREGTLKETKDVRCDKTFALVYTLGDADKLKKYPKLSLAAVERIADPLPMYKEEGDAPVR